MAQYLSTIRGTLASASLQEMFVHSFAIISQSPADTVAQALSTHWQTCLNTGVNTPLKLMFPVEVVYNEVTVAQIINPEPPEPRLSTASHVQFTPIQGSGGGGMLPPQCAIAVSMKAGTKPNGVPAKGRFYLPTPSAAILDPSSGSITLSNQTIIQENIAQFWANMNLAGHAPALWSRVRGTVVPWDAIRVGNKVDTIRRRRNELPELYTQYVSVPAAV